MQMSFRFLMISLALATGAVAQFNAELSFISAGPAVVAPGGQMIVSVRITNNSGVAWQPLTPVGQCPQLMPYTIDVYTACPTYPSPAVGSNWGKILLHLVAYQMDLPDPYEGSTNWWVDVPLPSDVQPGESVVVNGTFTAPAPPGNYVLAAMNSMFGCCSFTSRVLNSSREGFDLSPHFEFQVASDTTAPSLLLSGPLAGACNLWPANNKMVDIGTIRAIDSQNAINRMEMSVSSNDPTSSPDDMAVQVVSTDTRSIRLRASRGGGFGDRVYTMAVQAWDTVGNRAATSLTCTVPHDQRK